MLNQGNVLPPAGGKDIKRYSSYGGKRDKYTSDGTPTTDEMEISDFSVSGDKPSNTNVRPIADGQGPRPNPSKRTILPESDDALDQYAGIAVAKLSQGVFTHEQNVDIPAEGFNDPANLKV